MKGYPFILFFFFLRASNLSFAQPLLTTPQHMACYDRYTGGFFVLPDSTSYWRYNLETKQWKRYALKLDIDIPFDQFALEHNPLPGAPGKVFFVNRGCGTVYLLQKGWLRRVDASFAHKNQFEGMLYAYRGKPYMFGGYGFFQTKNVHTYYEPTLGEWFELFVQKGPKPSGRQGMFVLREGNNLYTVGGYQNAETEKQNFIPEVWKFNMQFKTWDYLGSLSVHVRNLLAGLPMSSMQSSKLLAGGARIVELDVIDNELRYYSRPSFVNTKRWLLSANRKWVMMLIQKGKLPGLSISVQPKNSFLGAPYKRSKLFIKQSWYERITYKEYLYISLLINLLIAGAWFYSKRSWQPIKFNFGSPKLKEAEFDAQEWLFLKKLQELGEIELAAVSEYIAEEGLSYDAQKKRRETFLKNIRVKIALQTQIPLDRVLPEGRHQLDKRMKMVRWTDGLEME
jgi:hypothetical protein